MPRDDARDGAQQHQQDIEALKRRHRELDRQKTTAEADERNAREQLKKLQDDAVAAYGTADVAELEQRLAEMRADNERKRAEYQKHLDELERKLKEVERQYEEKE
jgi:hypothetical protein